MKKSIFGAPAEFQVSIINQYNAELRRVAKIKLEFIIKDFKPCPPRLR